MATKFKYKVGDFVHFRKYSYYDTKYNKHYVNNPQLVMCGQITERHTKVMSEPIGEVFYMVHSHFVEYTLFVEEKDIIVGYELTNTGSK